MKNCASRYLVPWAFACFLLVFSSNSFAQVGINTTNPRTMLEVAGSTNINGAIQIKNVNAVKDTDESSFVVQTDKDFVKVLDASQGEGLVIAYFQEYRLKNMLGDWVAEFNTNLNTEDYVITIISSYFNQGLKMSSDFNNFSIPYCSAFEKDGTWRIIADYPGAEPRNSSVEGEWVISTLILPKVFSKALKSPVFTLTGDRQGGSASTPIIN